MIKNKIKRSLTSLSLPLIFAVVMVSCENKDNPYQPECDKEEYVPKNPGQPEIDTVRERLNASEADLLVARQDIHDMRTFILGYDDDGTRRVSADGRTLPEIIADLENQLEEKTPFTRQTFFEFRKDREELVDRLMQETAASQFIWFFNIVDTVLVCRRMLANNHSVFNPFDPQVVHTRNVMQSFLDINTLIVRLGMSPEQWMQVIESLEYQLSMAKEFLEGIQYKSYGYEKLDKFDSYVHQLEVLISLLKFGIADLRRTMDIAIEAANNADN